MDQFSFFRLEDRTVFDATLPLLLDPDVQADAASWGKDPYAAEHLQDDLAAFDASIEDRTPQLREIAFIDSSLPDLVDLLAGVSPGAEVVFIDPGQDGLEVMSDILTGRSGYDAIHILGHGDSGLVVLGSSRITNNSIENYSDIFSQIGSALKVDGDILFYGCNIADNQSGEWLVERIAELTGADVAASNDLTGAAELGGDWDLEFSVGVVEAPTFNADSWQHILHTNSVGFDIVNNNGTLTLNFFYGSWHSDPAAEGALSLFTLRSGGNRDNYADYTVEAYGNGGALTDATVPFQTVESGSAGASVGGITFASRYDSNGFTNTELDAAGFDLGTTYYFADSSKLYGYRNSSDQSSFTSADTTNNGAYSGSQVYKHQWASIVGIQAGTYTAYYDDNPVGETQASRLSANWSPQTAIRQMIFTIASDGSITLGSSSAVTKSGLEDTDITFADSDFTNSFSGTLGNIKIKSLPTSGTLKVSGVDVVLNQELDATDRGNLVYVPDADINGSDTFNWEAYDTGASAYIGEDTAVNISVTAVNDEPGLTANAVDPSFTEGDSNGVALFTGATLTTTPDGTQNISEIVLTSSGLVDGTNERLIVGESEFALVNTASVLAPASSSSGTPAFSYIVAGNGASVTLSGTWTTTQAKALIESIKYKNYSNDIDAAGTRDFTITSVKDAGGTANSGDDTKTVSILSTVSLTAVNDEPTLTATGLNPTYTENQSAVKLFTNAAASTVESDQNFSSLTLTVTNVTDGSDELLTIDGSEIALTAGTSSTSTNSLSAAVSLSGSTATITISGGLLSSSQLETLIETIAYRHGDDDPTDANRVVTITAVTDNGASTAPDDNSKSLSISSTVNVNPVNDLPVITLPSSAYQTEKTSGNATGSFTLTGLGLSDADDATVTSVVLSLSQVSSAQYGTLNIANTSGVTTAGGATISGDGTDEITLTGTVSQINSALAGGVTYGALANQDVIDDGQNVLTITATDASGGVTTVTKNITVMPAVPNASSLNALAVEDTVKTDLTDLATKVEIPGATVGGAGGYYSYSSTGTAGTGGNGTGSIGSAMSTASWNAATGSGSTSIIGFDIAGDGSKGYLFLDDGSGNATGDLSGADRVGGVDGTSASGKFIFVPPSNFSGAVEFFYTYSQNSLTSNVARVLVYVEGVNDAPTISVSGAKSVDEEATLTFAGSDIELADSDVSSGLMELSLSVANGSLTLGSTSGITFAEGADGTPSMKIRGTEAALETALTNMTYVGLDDFYGSETLTINLNDLGNSGTGGVLTAAQQTIAITVNNVNDAPNLSATMLGTSGSPVSFTENGVPSFLFSGASISDNETDDISQLVLTVTNLADGANEKLVINGSTVSLTHGTSAGISSVSVSGTTATVTITPGTALTLAEANTLVNNIRYLNTDGDATLAARAVTLSSITDDGGGSATRSLSSLSSYVGISPVNSEPTLSATTGAMVEFDENDAAVSIFSSADASPVEAGQGFLSLEFTVTNVDDTGYEAVTVDGTEFLLDDAVTGSTAANGYTYSVSLTGTTATVTVSGTIAEADYEALINGIKYRHTGDNPTTTNHRVVAITSVQDDGGTSSGGDDTLAVSGISRMVMVTAANDAPTGVGSLSNLTKTVGESTTVPTASAFSDVEGDSLTYTMQGAPRGLVINASTGVISGAPLRAGTFTVTVTATDPGSASAQQTFTITVAASGAAKMSKERGSSHSQDQDGDIFTPDVTAPNAQSTLLSSGAVARSIAAPILSGLGGGGTGSASAAARADSSSTIALSFASTNRMVANQVSQTFAASGQTGFLVLPSDTFVSPSTPSSELAITATLEDGSPLPDWIEFDPQQQTFQFTPPPEVSGLIGLMIRAVDNQGRQAVTTGSIFVGDGQEDELLSPSQSSTDDQKSPDSDADSETNTPEPDDRAMLDWDELERVYATASSNDAIRPGTPWLHAVLA